MEFFLTEKNKTVSKPRPTKLEWHQKTACQPRLWLEEQMGDVLELTTHLLHLYPPQSQITLDWETSALTNFQKAKKNLPERI